MSMIVHYCTISWSECSDFHDCLWRYHTNECKRHIFIDMSAVIAMIVYDDTISWSVQLSYIISVIKYMF